MPVYKQWRSNAKEAWFALSDEEQASLMEKVTAALDEVGGKSVVICSAGWSNDKWQWFGLEEFPDVAAAQRHTELLNELNWFRYVDSESQLGTSQ